MYRSKGRYQASANDGGFAATGGTQNHQHFACRQLGLEVLNELVATEEKILVLFLEPFEAAIGGCCVEGFRLLVSDNLLEDHIPSCFHRADGSSCESVVLLFRSTRT